VSNRFLSLGKAALVAPLVPEFYKKLESWLL
jgi:hypothetical protein